MSLAFFVNVNDIFDITNIISAISGIDDNRTSNIIFAKRIDHAFRKDGDGKNFWENFFYCKHYEQLRWEYYDQLLHEQLSNEQQLNKKLPVFFYVFTKQQLMLLQCWWNKKMKEADQGVIDNLEGSKAWFIEKNSDPLKIGKTEHLIDRFQFYYVDDPIASRKPPRIVRLLFNVSPPFKGGIPKNAIDFFSQDVIAVDADEVNDDEKRKQKIRTMVHNGLKFSVENLIKTNLGIKDKNYNKLRGEWLFYLGNVHYYEHSQITYCEKTKHNCRLAEFVL